MLNYKDIAKIFEEIELRLISSLKRNLIRHKLEEKQYGFDWSAWQAKKLRNINQFRQENARIMNEYQNIIDTNTRQIMRDEFAQGMNGVNITTPQPILGTSAEIVRGPYFFGVDDTKMNKLIDDVVNLEKHAETAALRTMDDVYRQTVNKAQLAMNTGSITLQQAIDMAVQDFLNKGINCIVYRDGRRVNITDYVRMALRTTATRANLQGMSAKIRQLGYDTVLVSSYGMCSDTCLPWQGRPYVDDVFSMWDGEIQERLNGELWGKSHYCGKYFPLLSTAIHAGLFHPNCRHTITMWRDGDPLPEPQDNSDIQRRYRLEQHQRQLENKIRKAKRLVAGQSDLNNLKEAKKRLREAQKELRVFITDTNHNEGGIILKRDYGKEKIYTVSGNPPITQGDFEEQNYKGQNLQNDLTFSNERIIIKGRGSGTGNGNNEHYYELIGKIDYNDKKAVARSLMEFEEKYKNSDIEHCRVITVSGDVYEVHGGKYTVDTSILGDKLKDSINEHNHVTGESQYSFSWEDLKSCADDNTKIAMAYDEKYRYSMIFPNKIFDEDKVYEAYQKAKYSVDEEMFKNSESIPIGDEQHERIKKACEELGIKYIRSSIT